MNAITDEAAQQASELSTRISQLEAISGEDLKNEMAALKATLIENPAACLLIKEEDIGLLVTNLRRILSISVASAATAKEKKPAAAKAKKLSAEELAAALDDM